MIKKLFCLLAFLLIALPSAAYAQGATGGQMGAMNTTWFQCHKNTDCVPVQTGCNKWQGVNRKHARDFKATVPKYGRDNVGCPSPAQIELMKKTVRGQCLNNFCAALLPRTSP